MAEVLNDLAKKLIDKDVVVRFLQDMFLDIVERDCKLFLLEHLTDNDGFGLRLISINLSTEELITSHTFICHIAQLFQFKQECLLNLKAIFIQLLLDLAFEHGDYDVVLELKFFFN